TIVIPNPTVQDVQEVAQRIRSAPVVGAAYPPAYPAADQPASTSAETETVVSGGVSGSSRDVKALRALELFLAGKGQREILAEVWGVSGGPPYQQAARAFNELLRRQIRTIRLDRNSASG
ncbi:MAG TPA: hypothetical protein PKE45_24580, partial [Caldilineaceae bacterium]|nr:hypothetical protein [Caldilineaceae bacterium]